MTFTYEDEIEQQVVERMGQMYYNYTEALNELKDIRSGKSVVIPADIEHARFMMQIAQFYISETHKETIRAIKQEG